ncbi:hypothetical protein NHX12_000529 [Muraenolepis orangiensis]|uniref:DUF4371 domain-containing protein n=2 Tax=Muraenolepis orangiensis TaxID=630683 RepID=A0A9Q0D8U0_9TELE|nr:hypothetical protein NHX12_000529 [Muraenolepis orangiensis]
MLVLYIKYRKENDVNYKTVFGGIIQLTACTARDIVQAITQFYSKHGLDLQRMVMLTSDGATVMLGKHNGVAALLKRQIPHLTEQHCVAHREDLGIDDAWKNVPMMRDVETLLRTVYSTFSRSTVKRGKMEDLAKILDEDTLSFRPLNEVRWLSRHQAVNAVLRNYTVLEEYCKRESSDNGDPVAKYCYKKLSDSKFKVTVTALGDVLGELAKLCLTLQRRNLTVMEGHCFARAKIEKLRSQYLKRKDVQWSDRVKEAMGTSSADGRNTGEITLFISKLCDHMDARFPEDELKEWSAFDIEALSSDISFDYGSADIATLAKKYEAILHHPQSMEAINSQYAEFKYIMKQKLKQGSISTFSDMVAAALRWYLVNLNRTMTALSTAEIAEIVRLYSTLNDVDKARSKYNLKCKKSTLLGPWRASRKRSGSAPGQQAAERLFMTHGQAAQSPDSNRIAECVCLRLLKEYSQSRNRPKDCKGKTLPIPQAVVHTYNHIKQLLEDSRAIQDQTNLVLVTINNTTVACW